VIALTALRAGQYMLVKASIAGAIVTNTQFMLGASFLLGGLTRTSAPCSLGPWAATWPGASSMRSSMFPVVIPFIVMRDPVPALRVSNAIAVFLLFVAGYAFGRITGRSPAWVGAAMIVLGSILVGITIALGG
jgi:Ca2+/H+ antiporter